MSQLEAHEPHEPEDTIDPPPAAAPITRRRFALGGARYAVGVGMLGAGLSAFAWLNVGFTIIWLFVAGQISREHRRKTV